ncbi:MAG: tRNA (cytidine(56)-2'-O)-methyltransferase [Candidatus Aenigmarchaeota archaeon]|nr:tRNA (cytidine(56)-2'-O)-methyltransferase [Candidatus Aenigmarchaeota archaeon]MBU5689351.1 tRNA (cytidine(56)-2'-O)-methyltransferase [Candidatus Aenigmarchaeota archaeon]
MSIVLLRLGHRIFRDQRMTTHCALTARAFGCEKMIYSGEKDSEMEKSIEDVAKRWGGDFKVLYEKNWKKVVNSFPGKKVLLTMYGVNLPNIIEKIRPIKDLLVIVGSEKVPADIYDMIDYQIAVSLQPHSEVAALAVFLDWYFQGKELEKEFNNAKIKIIPQEKGKKTILME